MAKRSGLEAMTTKKKIKDYVVLQCCYEDALRRKVVLQKTDRILPLRISYFKVFLGFHSHSPHLSKKLELLCQAKQAVGQGPELLHA